eukprot:CAMPEP_0118914012 /NCGR_PEP_ID=MMETSP1166-20130328/14546_1 /TAXON_ID=1104430 /ORGANISM="Chrysoreinhardia sp, Strain CCMP3193" /LENGTH=563 /DNA_ID=CAMNT_0006853577 /DNA_START=48 /DNA_END=1739 /DNA_ORIENTATION=+
MRLRVKLVDEDVSVVVPVDEGASTTVTELQFQLEQKLGDFLGDDVHIGKLEVDGFTLQGSDLASRVLRDDDAVTAVSMSALIDRELPKCDQQVSLLAKEDYETGETRFVSLLRTKTRFSVALGKGPSGPLHANATVYRLVPLKRHQSSTGVVVASYEGPDGTWKLEASLGQGDVLTLSNKPTHCDRPTMAVVQLGQDGKAKTVSFVDPETAPLDPQSEETPPLPPLPQTSGERLEDETLGEEARSSRLVGENDNVATGGDDAVVLAQSHVAAVETYQKIVDGDRTLRQFVAMNFILFNKSDAPYEVEAVEATLRSVDDFKDDDDDDDDDDDVDGWPIRLTGASFARRTGCCYYAVERELKVKPKSKADVAIVASVDIPLDEATHVWGPDKRSLHRSLATRRDVRLHFTTFDGKVKTITVRVPTNPQPLPSRASAERNLGPDILRYVTCDDTDAVERLTWAIATAKDAKGDYLKITRPPGSGGYLILRPNDLAKLAYQASKDHKADVQVDALRYRPTRAYVGACDISVFALLHRRRVFALRVELKTNSGQTIEAFPLPPLQSLA